MDPDLILIQKEVAQMDDVKVGPFGDKIKTWDKVSEDYERVYLYLLKYQ